MRHLPKEQVTFIHNPKTAGTSISNWLDSNFVTIQGRKHGHIVEVNEYFPRTQKTFGVVRNPWARMASWYMFSDGGRTNFKQWLLSRVSNFETNLSYQPFLLWARNWYRLHTPQHSWFGTHTIILKYETLEDDFVQIQELLGCNKPLPMLNSSVDYEYKDLYTPELRDFVWDIFLKDTIEYGYAY